MDGITDGITDIWALRLVNHQVNRKPSTEAADPGTIPLLPQADHRRAAEPS